MAIKRNSPGIYTREIDNTISIQQPGFGGIGIGARMNKGPLGIPFNVNNTRQLLDRGGRPIPGFNLVSWHSIDNILLYTSNVLVSRVEHQINESEHNNSNRIFKIKTNNAQVGLCLTGDAVDFNFKDESRAMIYNRVDFQSVNETNVNDVIGDSNINFSQLDNSVYVDNDSSVNQMVEDLSFNLMAKSLKKINAMGSKQIEYSTPAEPTFVENLKKGDVYNHNGKINSIGHNIYDDYKLLEFVNNAERDFSAITEITVSNDNLFRATFNSGQDFGDPSGLIFLESGNVIKLVVGGVTLFKEVSFVDENSIYFVDPFETTYSASAVVMTFIPNGLVGETFSEAKYTHTSSIIEFRDFTTFNLQVGAKIYLGAYDFIIGEIIDDTHILVVENPVASDIAFSSFAYSFGEISFASIQNDMILYTPNGTLKVVSKHADSANTSKLLLLVQDLNANVFGGELISLVEPLTWKNFKTVITQVNALSKSGNEYLIDVNEYTGNITEFEFLSGKATIDSNGHIIVPGDISGDLSINDLVVLVQGQNQIFRKIAGCTETSGVSTITFPPNSESLTPTTREFLLYKVVAEFDDASTAITGTGTAVTTSLDGLTVNVTGYTGFDPENKYIIFLSDIGGTVKNYREVHSVENSSTVVLKEALSTNLRDITDGQLEMDGNEQYILWILEDPPLVTDQNLHLGSIISVRGYTLDPDGNVIAVPNSEKFSWRGEARVLFCGVIDNDKHLVIDLLPNSCPDFEDSLIFFGQDASDKTCNLFKSRMDYTQWEDVTNTLIKMINYRDVLTYEFRTLTNPQELLIVNEDVSTLKDGIKFRFTYVIDGYNDYTTLNTSSGETLPSTEFLRIVAVSPGAWFNDSNFVVRVAVCDMDHLDDLIGIAGSNATFRDAFDFIDESDKSQLAIILLDQDNFALESWLVSVNPSAKDSENLSSYIMDVINNKSEYIRVFLNTGTFATEGPDAYKISFNTIQKTQIKGGYSSIKYEVPRYAYNKNRGTNFMLITTNNFITNEDIVESVEVFREVDDIEIAYLVDGEWSGNKPIQHHLIDICYSRNDSIAILGPNKNDIIGFKNKETITNRLIEFAMTNNPLVTANRASQFGGFFANYKQVYDIYNDVFVWIPISVDVVGINSWIDNNFDPWFAAAGLRRGVLRNVGQLAWNPNQENRDLLYKNKINPVVNFPAEGNLIFGVRSCYALQSSLGDLYNRKTLNYIAKNLKALLKIALFEFNDTITRNQVIAVIEPFLRSIQARRGLTDYQVQCDTTNNPPEIVEQNILVCDVYLKMANVVEVIELNFIITKTSAEFTEA